MLSVKLALIDCPIVAKKRQKSVPDLNKAISFYLLNPCDGSIIAVLLISLLEFVILYKTDENIQQNVHHNRAATPNRLA